MAPTGYTFFKISIKLFFTNAVVAIRVLLSPVPCVVLYAALVALDTLFTVAVLVQPIP